MKDVLKIYKETLKIKNPIKFWSYSKVEDNPESYGILRNKFIEIIDGKQEVLDAYKMVCENKSNLSFSVEGSSLLLSMAAFLFSIIPEEQKQMTNIVTVAMIIMGSILLMTILLIKQNMIEKAYKQILYVLNRIYV